MLIYVINFLHSLNKLQTNQILFQKKKTKAMGKNCKILGCGRLSHEQSLKAIKEMT